MARIIFLGTKGEIEESSPEHKMHSSLLIEKGNTRLLIDLGESWKGQLKEIKPTHIVLTHAHSDHAWGFTPDDFGTDVYMLPAVWQTLDKKIRDIIDFKELHRFEWEKLGDIEIKPIPVSHSWKFPTNGFFIRLNNKVIGYFPDVLFIPNYRRLLKGLDLYIGDGSYLYDAPGRVRRDEQGRPYGHALIRDQVRWCANAGVKNIIFTHCGKQIVEMPKDKLREEIEKLEREYGVSIRIATDNLRIRLAKLKPLPGIYLVPNHARYIAEGLKTLIVSAKPAPKDYLQTPLYFIQDDRIYGILRITGVETADADWAKKALFNRHLITEKEWNRWWPDVKTVYLYHFTVEKLFIPPIPYKPPRGVQKWIREVRLSVDVMKQIQRLWEHVNEKLTRKFYEDEEWLSDLDWFGRSVVPTWDHKFLMSICWIHRPAEQQLKLYHKVKEVFDSYGKGIHELTDREIEKLPFQVEFQWKFVRNLRDYLRKTGQTFSEFIQKIRKLDPLEIRRIFQDILQTRESKLIEVFMRDYLVVDAFPIDFHVADLLKKFKIPRDSELIISYCHLLGIPVRTFNRMVYSLGEEALAQPTSWMNAPTFAYYAVYKRLPPGGQLPGRTNAPKKSWKHLKDVDIHLKDEWLEALNSIEEIEIRSTDEGKSEERVAHIVFRMRNPEHDDLACKIAEILDNDPDLYAMCGPGREGRIRVVVAGKVQYGKPGWEEWWQSVSEKIRNAVNQVLKKASLELALRRAYLITVPVEKYNPREIRTKVLQDDWRIVCGWYANKKRGLKLKKSYEEILGYAVKIVRELAKRGIKFHPDSMKPYARELFEKVRNQLEKEGVTVPIEVKASLERESIEEIGRKAREPSPFAPIHHYGEVLGEEIQIEDVLKHYEKPMLLQKDYVCLVGGLANWGSTKGDIDLRIAEEDPKRLHVVKFRLGRALPPELAHRAQFHDKTFETFTSYVPLYDLALIPATERRLVRMQGTTRIKALRDEQARREALASFKEDKVEPLRFVIPLKGYRAYYRFAELVPEVVETWFKPEQFKQGVAVQKKYDGVHCLFMKKGDKIIFRTEDGEDVTDRIPTIVEWAKKHLPYAVTLDCEVELWLEGRHRPREEIAGYLHAKGKPDDHGVVLNVFDCIYFYDESIEHHELPGTVGDLHKKPYEVRLRYLKLIDWPQSTDEVPKTPGFNLTPTFIARTPQELIKYVKQLSKEVASEGAVVKSLDMIYELDGLTENMLKFKKMAELHAIVVDIQETKTKGVYTLFVGVRIPPNWKVPEKEIREVNGKKYMYIGKTFNVKGYKKPGTIVSISFHTLNHYVNRKTGEQWIRIYEPKFLGVREKQTVPDDAEEAIAIAKKLELYEKKVRLSLFPMDDKLHPAVMQNHYRGKSVHMDFRIKVNNYLVGMTIAHEKPGRIKEDVKTLAQAKEIERHWEEYFKMTNKPQTYFVGRRKLWITWKKPEPVAWLNVEGVVEPGQVGATKREYGVFSIVDKPKVMFGAQKAAFREFFIYGKKFNGRWVARLLPNPWREEMPRAEFVWLFWKPENQTPYVLSQRAVQKKWIPPKGVSCLPPEIREKIPEEFKYWLKENKSERLALRDELVKQIRQGKIKLENISVVELADEPPKIERPIKAKGVLQHHWWEAEVKPVRVGPSEEHWDLRIDWNPNKPPMHFILTDDPTTTDVVAATFKWCPEREWMKKGEKIEYLPPGTPGNPTRATPAYIEIIDKFDVTIYESSDVFVKMDFHGKKLKGHWVAIRTDPRINIWELRREEAAPQVKKK